MQTLSKRKRLFSLKTVMWVSGLCLSLSLWAADQPASNAAYVDRSHLVAEQTGLLKNRLIQAEQQLAVLQRQDQNQAADFSLLHPSKEVRSQAALDTAVAKSNVDSVNMELVESRQTISRIEKDVQEIENQLNVFSIFGLKIARTEAVNVPGLQTELDVQQNLLTLEKIRATYLTDLQKIAEETFQLQKSKYARINAFLKSRTIMQLKEQQAQSESVFQQQQSVWLERLNNMYVKLGELDAVKVKDKTTYVNLQREIFYANENLNLAYLQMLSVRYQDQLQQLRVAISHSTSITLLNKANDQVQALSKQSVRVDELLQGRIKILSKRRAFLAQNNSNTNITADQADLSRLTEISNQYEILAKNMSALGEKILTFRYALDKALQYELSSRQGLPGFSAKAWMDLGAEICMVPTLTYQMVKSLVRAMVVTWSEITYFSLLLIALLEGCLLGLFSFANKLLARLAAGMVEHKLGHINLTRLSIQLLRRNLTDIFVIINLYGLCSFSDIPSQSCNFILNLALVWLVFKAAVTMARVCLVETAHDYAGHDVILYHRLKWSFLLGGVVTALTVFMHQLPVIYEVKDLFDRLFLIFLLVVSIFLLRSWEILPDLILLHVDEKRLYLKKVVRLLGLLIPLILLINTAIGLFGFVNFVLTISWYESVFVAVLVSYLILRGLMIDAMVVLSSIMIRYVANGWLWTEAFLKPMDKVLHITLFASAWVALFAFYGWNQQSPVVVQLNNLLHYQLLDLFNTSITVISIIAAIVVISVTFWAARWVREFSYRLLAARTADMGLRNSLAIFSQYATIVIGLLICLKVLGIDLTALKVIAGAFAFGVGLGLRDLFNNFASGFLLLIERPLRVGDTVSINGHEGEVMQIGSRAVTVRTWDHMDMYVPNAEIFSKSFINWNSKDNIIRTVATIKVCRQDNPHVVQALIYHVLSQNKEVLHDPAAEVFLKEISDGLIEFEVRYYLNLRHSPSRVGLRSAILLALWEVFEQHGIKPPYPQQEVLVRSHFPLMPAYEHERLPKTERSESDFVAPHPTK